MTKTTYQRTHRLKSVSGKLILLLLITIMLSSNGCELINTGNLLKTVDKLDQMVNRADTTASKIAGGLVQGMRDSLTSERTKRELDSLVNLLSSTAVRSIVDTLSSSKSKAELDSLLTFLLTHARDSATSEYTTAKINKMIDKIGNTLQIRINSIRDSLLGDGTSRRIRAMATDLLGPATRTALDTIIAHGIKAFAQGYQNDISPLVNKEETTISKAASRLLWTGGAIIALLLILGGVLFVRNKRHRQIAELLTLQIHRIGDEKVYDDLVKGIQSKAQELKIEPQLRQMLLRQGINK